MNRGGTTGEIKQKLIDYKRRFYLNQIYQGTLTSVFWLLGLLLILISVEYWLNLGPVARAVGFWSFVIIALSILSSKVAYPFYKYFRADIYLSDKDAATQIGRYFPELGDKFINFLALSEHSIHESDLLLASIAQKGEQIKPYNFPLAIDFKKTYAFLKSRLLPLSGVAVILAIIVPELFTESTARYLNYSRSYAPEAPFSYVLSSKTLTAFRGEDFTFKVELNGQKLPASVVIVFEERQLAMIATDKKKHEYTFSNLDNDLNFRLLAGGFFSEEYRVKVVDRPSLSEISLVVQPPGYLGQSSYTHSGSGSLQVPEGSKITWSTVFKSTDSVLLKDASTPKKQYVFTKKGEDQFQLTLSMKSSMPYEIIAKNSFGGLREKVGFEISVIKDEAPTIKLSNRQDTATYNNILVNGIIEDDHGFSKLNLIFFITDENNKTGLVQRRSLAFNKEVSIQPFYTYIDLQELQVKNGEKITYKIEVCDNDGVNGSKCVESASFIFEKPSEKTFEQLSKQSAEKLEDKIEGLYKKSSSLVKSLDRLEQKLKSKSELSWSDKKDLSELVDKNKQLLNELSELNELQEKLKTLEKNVQEFSPELLEKAQALQELMKQVLDPETQKLLEELQKLLEEKKEDSKVKENLDKLQKKNQNIENELNRALELYKNLQLDKKIEETVKDLRELAEEQVKASETKPSEESLSKQDSINSAFEEIKKELSDIEKLNQEIEEKRPLNKLTDKANQIKENLNKSKNSLQKGQKKEGRDSQKEAAEKMENLADELETASTEQQVKMVEENIRDLQSILDNLLSLSFQLEEQMKEYRVINQADPRYIALSQKQLKLSEDAKMIEDSLLALAKRVFEIQSFVTREVSELRSYMEESALSIKQRKPSNASGKQQYAMTSANNLALLLDDVLKSLQNQMSAMQSNGKCTSGKPKTKGRGKPQPSLGNLGDMQKQLNEQIEKLKGKGGNGEQLSEEYAKIAAQQEQLRQALKQLEKMLKEKGENPGNGLGDLAKDMEETEKDIVNKRITQETLLRQKEIETRLLEAEKSLRERDQSQEREAEFAKIKERSLPPDLEKYLKDKQKQVEQIRRVDPSLKPFYKNEVKRYFKSLIENKE